MSVTLLTFLGLFALFFILGIFRPVWGVALYMLSFFACPAFWWWGDSISEYRWNLYGGIGLLVAVVISKMVNSDANRFDSKSIRKIIFLAGLLLANATAVHFFLARSWDVSSGSYELVAKFVLLFFMIVAAIRTPDDFRIVLLSLILGAGYLGYEATINDRGRIEAGRLEGVGAPGAHQANELASLCVTILPLAGTLFITGRWPHKIAMLAATPLILNITLLCNSRGAFLSAIASAIMFAIVAPKKVRRQVIVLLTLGCVATWLLLGDPQIVNRFLTIFSAEGERDDSAAGRLDYWKAGLRMIADYPLGAGGYGFKRVHGPKYIKEVNSQEFSGRSVHNGFINETCEWGIQGFLTRMAFFGGALLLCLRTARQCAQRGEVTGGLFACAIIASSTAFLATCMFGDYLDNEWGYWLVALSVAHSRVYANHAHFRSANIAGLPPQNYHGQYVSPRMVQQPQHKSEIFS